MNAAAKIDARSTLTDMAGNYADTMGGNMDRKRTATVLPAANEVPARHFSAEALDAKSLVDRFVDVKARQVGRNTNGSGPETAIDLQRSRYYVQDLLAPEVRSKPDPKQAYFFSTQEWDGYVTEIRDDEFDAIIYPISHTGNYREDRVTIPISAIADAARDTFRSGAIFRLATGRYRRNRQIINGAKIYFRKGSEISSQRGLTRQAIENFFAE